MDNQIDKLSIFKHSLKSFSELNYLPAAFVINLTHRCNLICNMCIQYGDNYKNDACPELPLHEWIKFIESVAWFKPRITLLGGEPLIYPEIGELLRILSRYNGIAELVTNGYFLEEYLEDIYNYNNVDLIISIDGTGDNHNKIRNSTDSFERIVKSLELIKRKGGNTTNKLLINHVVLPDNIDNLLEFLKFINEYCPRIVILQHPMYSSPELNIVNNTIWGKYFSSQNTAKLIAKKTYLFNIEYIEKLTYVLNKVHEIKNSLQTEIYFSPGLSTEEIYYYYSEPTHPRIHPGRICSRPWRRLTINPNGDVLVCLDYLIGNITSNDITEIWNGTKINKFRDVLLNVGRFPICTRCCDFYNDRDYLHMPINSTESPM